MKIKTYVGNRKEEKKILDLWIIKQLKENYKNTAEKTTTTKEIKI